MQFSGLIIMSISSSKNWVMWEICSSSASKSAAWPQYFPIMPVVAGSTIPSSCAIVYVVETNLVLSPLTTLDGAWCHFADLIYKNLEGEFKCHIWAATITVIPFSTIDYNENVPFFQRIDLIIHFHGKNN